MRIERLGELTVRITGGSDGRGGGTGPAVVLLHGFGAPGDDLVVLANHLRAPAGTRFVFPEAPLRLPDAYGEARAWWLLDMARIERDIASGRPGDRSDEHPDELPERRRMITAMLDEVEARLGATDIVLGGFSQGSMLACDVALMTERPLAGLVLLSTTMLAARQWRPAMPGRAGLPVFMSHGKRDHLLSFAVAERMRHELGAAGLKVSWHQFAGGHEIPMPVLDALGGFLTGLAP